VGEIWIGRRDGCGWRCGRFGRFLSGRGWSWRGDLHFDVLHAQRKWCTETFPAGGPSVDVLVGVNVLIRIVIFFLVFRVDRVNFLGLAILVLVIVLFVRFGALKMKKT
jgi:hypothetical protein